MKHYSYLLIMVLCLAACADPQPPKEAHVVKEVTEYKFILEGYKPLSAPQLQAFDAFMGSVPSASIASVEIVTPQDLSLKATNNYLYALSTHIASHGITSDTVHVQPTEIEGAISVTLAYSKIIPPGPCPDWSKNAIVNYNNTGFSNLGCAENNNIAVQLMDPEDLERGKSTPVYDATRDSVKLGVYLSNTGGAASSGSTTGATSSGASTTATSGTSP